MTETRYPRNKASIKRSGIDPACKSLARVHAIKSSTEKKYLQALNRVEDYWESVFDAIDEQEKGK